MFQSSQRWIIAAVATMCVLSLPAPAAAEAKAEASYAYERVWPAAVRFLRIDEGHPITEKDAEAGYVLFEVREDGKSFRGALELIRTEDDDGREAVRLVLRIEDRPSYMERGIVERLERKLRDELGDPAEPPKTKNQ